MAFSKERYEYHLTPRGWIEGSFKNDLGGLTEIEIPDDRVLTIYCYDELSSAFSKSYFSDQVSWESEDTDLVRELKERFGDRPDWFGYKMKQ